MNKPEDYQKVIGETVQFLCEKIDFLKVLRPADDKGWQQRNFQLNQCIAHKNLLDYLEEEACCSKLTKFEAALLNKEFYMDMSSFLYGKQRRIAAQADDEPETLVGLHTEILANLARAGIKSDAAFQKSLVTFEELLAKSCVEYPLAQEPVVQESSLVDKFEAIEITNVSRIAGEDLELCTTHQALYAKMLAQHLTAFETMQALSNSCADFLQSVADDNEYRDGSYTYKHYECDYGTLEKKTFAHEHIGSLHERFISIIMRHFTDKYNVSIDSPDFEELLGLEKPEEPRTSYYYRGRRDISDEELSELKAAQQTYDEAHDAYLESIIHAQIDHNLILDHIFLALDGKTFAEQAEEQIKDASRNASSTYSGKRLHEIKNKKITMKILYARKSWNDEYEVGLDSKDYRAILRALTYFDSDTQNSETYSGWHRFIGYNLKESDGIFSSHDVYGSKVTNFRYYKNGKFEVTFDSHANAQLFATDFLNTCGEAEDD